MGAISLGLSIDVFFNLNHLRPRLTEVFFDFLIVFKLHPFSVEAILPHEGNVGVNEETALSIATLALDVPTTDFVFHKICNVNAQYY